MTSMQHNRWSHGLRAAAAHVARGFMELSRNGFALMGLVVAFGLVTLVARPELRTEGEARLVHWLKQRQLALTGLPIEPQAILRATAADPGELPADQAAVASWISRKYRVAPEPISALVAEAWQAGQRARIDPTLILAVMAIESGFNPFAQSAMGAQGLMQVMTVVHSDKYESFGGRLAAFDPVTNLRVGARVLQECIARAGSVEGGLKLYVGAGNMETDGGYGAKVLAEQRRLRSVADGRPVPMFAPQPVPALAPPTAEPTAQDQVALADTP